MTVSPLHPLLLVFLVLLLSAPAAAADAGNVIAGLIGGFAALLVVLGIIGWLVRNRR